MTQNLVVFAGSILPALIWLLFWIREDRKHPEPLRLLVITFLCGMLAVVVALKIEAFIYAHITNETTRFIWWAVTEEVVKLAVAYWIILRRKEVDEPIDYVIYMIAVALGFAALENMLFLFSPALKGLITHIIFTGNLRFIGATLLHVVASASVGIAFALAFYKSRAKKHLYVGIGLILAIILHGAFNIAIMLGEGCCSMFASLVVWIAVVGVILLFEKIKKVHPVKEIPRPPA